MVEKRFALSGASSVSDLLTDEAPERVKRFFTISFSSLSGCSETLVMSINTKNYWK